MPRHPAASSALLSGPILGAAILLSFKRLWPMHQLRNPVMFCVYMGALVSTLCAVFPMPGSAEPSWFVVSIALCLWVTILFANFAEFGRGQGKAQAATLKAARQDTPAKLLANADKRELYKIVSSTSLKRDDIVLVCAGDMVPGDGQVIAGAASIDESAVTGESAPVIRAANGDRDLVIAGTCVLSDEIVVRITAGAGKAFSIP